VSDRDRDLIVTRALARVRVPDPSPAFWARLDAALDAEVDGRTLERTHRDRTAPAADTAAPPSNVVPLLRSMARPGRRSFPSRLLAAAAVVAIGAVGAVVVNGRGDDSVVTTVGTDGTVATESAPAPTTAPTAAPTTAAPPVASADAPVAVAAVRSFLEAVGAGDVNRAHSFLGVRSEQYADTAMDGADRALSTATETWGTWIASPDRQFSTVVMGPGEIVVVVSGTRTSEGITERRADAFPVVENQSAGGWLVEPWVFDATTDGRLDPATPAADADGIRRLAPGQALEVGPPRVDEVWFAIAGTNPVAVSPVTGPNGRVARWLPPTLTAEPTPVVIAVRDGMLFHAVAVLVAATR
jgi:hypothetical protein